MTRKRKKMVLWGCHVLRLAVLDTTDVLAAECCCPPPPFARTHTSHTTDPAVKEFKARMERVRRQKQGRTELERATAKRRDGGVTLEEQVGAWGSANSACVMMVWSFRARRGIPCSHGMALGHVGHRTFSVFEERTSGRRVRVCSCVVPWAP